MHGTIERSKGACSPHDDSSHLATTCGHYPASVKFLSVAAESQKVRSWRTQPRYNLRTRGTPLFVSLSSVIAHTIASARSGDRLGPS